MLRILLVVVVVLVVLSFFGGYSGYMPPHIGYGGGGQPETGDPPSR